MSEPEEGNLAETNKSEKFKDHPEGACFLAYEPHSTGRLLTYYSKIHVPEAIGIWLAGEGKSIPKYKYKQNFGRIELIRGC